MSAFTTNQASGAYAPYGMIGVLADIPIEQDLSLLMRPHGSLAWR